MLKNFFLRFYIFSVRGTLKVSFTQVRRHHLSILHKQPRRMTLTLVSHPWDWTIDNLRSWLTVVKCSRFVMIDVYELIHIPTRQDKVISNVYVGFCSLWHPFINPVTPRGGGFLNWWVKSPCVRQSKIRLRRSYISKNTTVYYFCRTLWIMCNQKDSPTNDTNW